MILKIEKVVPFSGVENATNEMNAIAPNEYNNVKTLLLIILNYLSKKINLTSINDLIINGQLKLVLTLLPL